MVSLKENIKNLLIHINKNLKYAIKEHENPKNSNTKEWLMNNISELTQGFEIPDFEKNDLIILKNLRSLNDKLLLADDKKTFVNIKKESLIKLSENIDLLLSDKIDVYNKRINNAIENIIKNSKQKFFHHNTNKNITSKLILQKEKKQDQICGMNTINQN